MIYTELSGNYSPSRRFGDNFEQKMRSRLLAIMRKEFIHIFRAPQTLGIVLIMPISMFLPMGLRRGYQTFRMANSE